MEEDEEEARALLEGRPDGAGRAAPGVSGALPAICDPGRLAHRLLVLLLMCFLGFGEGGAERRDVSDFPWEPRDPLSSELRRGPFPSPSPAEAAAPGTSGWGSESAKRGEFCLSLALQEVLGAGSSPPGAMDVKEPLFV